MTIKLLKETGTKIKNAQMKWRQIKIELLRRRHLS